jgi:hypothetical protein
MHIGLGIRMSGNRGAGGGFSPSVLFASGEAGDWFDPSDLSRMWQDTAGTTPVTADGQTVGLMLGQRAGANVELVTNGTFDAGLTGWVKGGGTADPISWDAANQRLVVTNDLAYFAAATQTLTGLTVGRSYMVTSVISDNTVNARTQISALAGATSKVIPPGGGPADFVFTATATSHVLIVQNNENTLGGVSFFDNISVKEVALTALTQSDAAKRPAYKTSAGLHWLQFDGTNDALASAATLNLSGTDKATVLVAERIGSASGIKMVFETSATSDSNNGSFGGYINGTGGEAPLRGSSLARIRFATDSSVSSSFIRVCNFDISGAVIADEINLRTNGAADNGTISVAGPAGTGNFGNHTLNVGSRSGTSLFFNGNIYFLLIRGALTSGADLTALEGFAAAKTGVTLP